MHSCLWFLVQRPVSSPAEKASCSQPSFSGVWASSVFFSLLLTPTPKSFTEPGIWVFWNATRFKQLQEQLPHHFKEAGGDRMTPWKEFSVTPFTSPSLGTSEVLYTWSSQYKLSLTQIFSHPLHLWVTALSSLQLHLHSLCSRGNSPACPQLLPSLNIPDAVSFCVSFRRILCVQRANHHLLFCPVLSLYFPLLLVQQWRGLHQHRPYPESAYLGWDASNEQYCLLRLLLLCMFFCYSWFSQVKLCPVMALISRRPHKLILKRSFCSS